MPNSLPSTASRFWAGSMGTANIVERPGQQLARPLRSMVTSCSRRESSGWSRRRCPTGDPWLRRSCGRRCRAGPRNGGSFVAVGEREPSAALGGKNVGLKSSPIFCSLAQSIQPWKWAGSIRSRSTGGRRSQIDGMQAEAMLSGIRLKAFGRLRSWSGVRALPG